MNDFVIGLILIIVLILLNGFFVAAEFSLVSIRRTRVEELVANGQPGSAAVDRATHDLYSYIATTQLGITLASLGLGWVGEPALSQLIDPLIELVPIPPTLASLTAHSIGAAISFVVITFLHVVIGEMTPKAMALQRTEQVALTIAQPMTLIAVVFKPGIWVLNSAGNLMLRLLGFQPAASHENVHSVEEIKLVMAASADEGVLGDTEYDMVDSIFDLRELTARQVMIPRMEIVALPVEVTLKEMIELHQTTPHEKFPLYEGDIDHIVGILYVRDVLESLAEGKLDTPIKKLMHEAIFVPDSARINGVLKTFRDKRQHVAVVLDEYGGTAGLLTLEDIMEEIAGDLPDLFDPNVRPDIARRADGRWDINGLTPIEDVNKILSISLQDDNYDTIGGFVMGKLERVPKRGDLVSAGGVVFEVDQVDGMRIDRLLARTRDGKKS